MKITIRKDDKMTLKEMRGFNGINLRDERINYIERKDLDDVVVDADCLN